MACAEQFEILPVPPPAPAPARRPFRRPAEDAGKRSFLRTVSHELRTPLNAVIGFSEIIARELHGPIGDPRYAEHAARVRESGLELLSLVNQILDIARLESGAMDMDLRPEPVEEVLAEALGAAREAAAARDVRLVPTLEPGAEQVVCDRRGLSAVLAALLSNAVTASPAGAEVRLTARRVGERVHLEVADAGPGIPADDLPRLMRPFEQGENALVRRGKGAGLGLPLARLFCQAMDGRLQLRNDDAGVTATVRLPAA